MPRHKCYGCKRIRPEYEMLKIGKHYICNRCVHTYTIADPNSESFNRLFIDNENVFACKSCRKAITKELYNSNNGYCRTCGKNYLGSTTKTIKCLKCGEIHGFDEPCCRIRTMDIPNIYGFVGQNGSKSWNPKGYSMPRPFMSDHPIYGKNVIKRQSIEETPIEVNDTLTSFYEGSDSEYDYWIMNYWRNIDVRGEIEFMNIPRVRNMIDEQLEHKRFRSNDISAGRSISKYSDMTVTGVKDGKIERTKINIMGKITKSYESINKFYKEVGRCETKSQINGKYSYRLSTDWEHKLEGFNANSKFGSCQQPNNNSSYAAGAYDFITNGCNVPLLIYKEGYEGPIGRILCRIMYDRKGTEYLVVERLYHNGEFGCQHGEDSSKGYIHRAIIEDLIKKGFNVVVSPYSAHDRSVRVYMLTMGMSKGKEVKDLYQPLRVMNNHYGYYCDGGTVVYSYEDRDDNGCIQRYGMDFLNKGYLLSLD